MRDDAILDNLVTQLRERNPGETLYQQSVRDVLHDLPGEFVSDSRYRKAKLIERILEPDRVLIFRVTWQDDCGVTHVNRGFRVQHSNAIGPYKGGTRFHPSVNLDVFKFLAFEQSLKNALTGLPLGGGKGGSDFDPKGKSDNEIMRFCQAFMTELFRHVGEDTDIPAGDIGVGQREIGYLFGQYKRLTNKYAGVLTGKEIELGGSHVREEATGFGVAHFMSLMLQRRNETIEGKSCVVSGAGNVATHTAKTLIARGARVLTLSDSTGFILVTDGISPDLIDRVIELKLDKNASLRELANEHEIDFHRDQKPWNVACDLAFPCATEKEITEEDADQLLKNGCTALCEGANKPVTSGGIRKLIDAEVLVAPGKAANAGGVAISGLEMAQNQSGLRWGRERIREQLCAIMGSIHEECVEHGQITANGYVNYVRGANRAGFTKLAYATAALGIT